MRVPYPPCHRKIADEAGQAVTLLYLNGEATSPQLYWAIKMLEVTFVLAIEHEISDDWVLRPM
ncbi:MAG: hypothetical protein EA374_08505 [Acholeplasmatales bacterium]|nr:MAG: hypothetical protein EA374_08505 [Acholeplasmatales bacterium]